MRETKMALCGRRLGANGWGLALLLALAGAGCIGGQTGSEAKDSSPLDRTEPCDPLSAHIEPIELGEILGVGRGADGTLYVADRPAGSHEARVFVSEDEALVRKRVG